MVLSVPDGHWDGLSRVLADLADQCLQAQVSFDATETLNAATPGAVSGADAQAATDLYLDRQRALAEVLQARSETASKVARMFEENDNNAGEAMERIAWSLRGSAANQNTKLPSAFSAGAGSEAWAKVASRLGGGG